MKKVLLLLALLAVTTVAEAQGTIQIANTAGTRFRFHLPGTVTDFFIPPLYFGVFVGLTADTLSSQPIFLLATNSTATAGIISSLNRHAYPIPGIEPGTLVFIQVRGWEDRFGTDWRRGQAEGWFGQTDIKPFVLGPEGGPGTIIWGATDPTKFQAIVLQIPEPSMFALLALSLVSLRLAITTASRGRLTS
jgi:hypothetical protein